MNIFYFLIFFIFKNISSTLKNRNSLTIKQEYFDRNSTKTYVTTEETKEIEFHLKRNKSERFLTIYAYGGMNKNLENKENDVELYISFNGENIPVFDKLYNGKITSFNELDYYSENEDDYYIITIKSSIGTYVTVGNYKIQEPNYARIIEENSYPISFYGNTDLNIDLKQCFQIKEMNTLSEVQIQILSKTENVLVTLQTEIDSQNSIKKYEVKGKGNIIYNSELYKGGYKYFCVSNIDSNELSYTLQISNYLNNEVQFHQDPIIPGYIYPKILKKKEYFYYRPSSFIPKGKNITFNIQSKKGELKVYVVKCDNYPDCRNYTDDIMSELIEKEKAFEIFKFNDFFLLTQKYTFESNLMDKKQYLYLVKCENSNDFYCNFRISFYNEDSYLEILKEERFLGFLRKGEFNKIIFKIPNINYHKIFVSLNVFTGDSILDIRKKPEGVIFKKYYITNKQLCEFSLDESYITFSGTYLITVNATFNSFYSINYIIRETNKENIGIIGSGISLVESIPFNLELKSQEFQFHNKYKYSNSSYIVSFMPLNCRINVNYQNTLIQPQNDYLIQKIISKDDIDYEDENYIFKVDFISMDFSKTFQDELCMFYIGGREINKKTEILVSEGSINEIYFSDKIDQIRYIYPHSEKNKVVTINIKMKDEIKISTTIFINQIQIKNYIFSHPRNIIIRETDINIHCLENQVCQIIVDIRAVEKKKSGVFIDIVIKSESSTAVYLRKNILINDIINDREIQYYYTDIREGEEGEIILGFNRGSGKILAKIVKKESYESQGNFRGKAVLPNQYSKDLLSFDFYSKKVKYNKNDTSICTLGCDLLIGILPDYDYIKYYMDYYISVREIVEKDNIEIPINQIIFGTIPFIEKTLIYDYYTFIIPKDSDDILFEFESNICTLLVNINENKPNIEHYNFKFEPRGRKVFKIQKKDFNSTETLKGKKITLGITADDFNSVTMARYNLKIRVPEKKYKELIEINSDQKSLCNKIECFFKININDYDLVTSMFVYSFLNETSEINIFGNIYTLEEYNSMSKDDIENNLPDEDKSQFKSTSKFNQELLEIVDDFKLFETNAIIIISVKSSKKGLLTFLSTFRKYEDESSSEIYPNPAGEQLFEIFQLQSINLKFPSDQNYVISLKILDGKGSYGFKNEESFIFNNIGEDIKLFNNNKEKILIINAHEQKDFSIRLKVMVSYKIKSLTNNFDFLKLGTSKEISYNNINNDNFNLEIYSNIENEEENYFITFNFWSFEKLNNDSSIDDFIILGGIFDDNFINEKIKKKETKIPEKKLLDEGIYDFTLVTGKYYFNSEKIKKINGKKKFLYLSIRKSPNNKNKYKEIKSSFSVISNNNINAITPINEYQQCIIFSKQNTSNNHKLKKGFPNDNYMILEFSSDYQFTNLLILDNINNQINTTKIINSTFEFGRQVIYLNILNTEDFIISIMENSTKEVNYFFKYITYESTTPKCISQSENISTSIIDNNNILLRFFPVICEEKGINLNFNITYNIRLIDTDNQMLNYSIIPLKNINSKSKRLFIRNENTTNFNETITNYGNTDLYHITIVAYIEPLNEILMYKPFNNEIRSYLTLTVIITGIAIIIITLSISIIYISGKDKGKSKANIENISNIKFDEVEDGHMLAENLI